MSDGDYIPWEYRDTKTYEQIEKSHTVADDVMRELAEALRECSDVHCGCLGSDPSNGALSRYDALKEHNE